MKTPMQFRFHCRCIIRVDHGVGIEYERNGRIPQFLHPVVGVQPTCHSDLDDFLAERSDVRNDVDMADTCLFGH